MPDPDFVLVPASGNVVALDDVDPGPTLSCYVINPDDPLDMTNTANPQYFASYATSTVSCTATDSEGNTSSATTFNIGVSFPYDINLILSNKPAKAGSTIPVDWQYLSDGSLIDSSSIVPDAIWFGPYDATDTSCSDPAGKIEPGNDSGSSGKRYSASSSTWQFSWQTPDLKGQNVLLVITPPGDVDSEATRCVRLK